MALAQILLAFARFIGLQLRLPCLAKVTHRMTTKRTCGCVALAAIIKLSAVNCVEAAVFNAKSLSFADVSAAVALASNGDAVVLPAGTATWTSTLQIAKGITLQGATTISGDHNTAVNGTPMSAIDQTIIIDNVVRGIGNNAPVISVNGLTSSQSFRLSGVTFKAGTVTTLANNGSVAVAGTCSNVRIDHCNFINLNSYDSVATFGQIFGVIDHNIFTCKFSNIAILAGLSGYGGGTFGDGSWADGPNFGTNKFIFIEDNTFNNNGGQSACGIDGLPGGRYVERYNILNGTLLGGTHGLDSGIFRGGRAFEYYGNIIYPTANCCSSWGGQNRSGTFLSYNNAWITSNSNFVAGKSLEVYRNFWIYPPWGGATGANSWDVNDTEGNGTYVSGHSPHLYDSGTHTGANSATVLTDSTKSWTTNQWLGYTVVNTRTNHPGAVSSNTSTTIAYSLYTDSGGPTKFNTGDGYKIYKVLVPLDGMGRGKGDLVSRVNGVGMNPVNTTTNTVAWPHQLLEPIYCWDTFNGQAVSPFPTLGQGSTVHSNRDFYYLNSGWTPGNPLTAGVAVGTLANRPTQCAAGTDITGVTTNPPGVGYWATDANGGSGELYVCAANNTWTAYYQPYVYPHPLVSDKPAPPQAPKNLRVIP
jgi:hypothetical protein